MPAVIFPPIWLVNVIRYISVGKAEVDFFSGRLNIANKSNIRTLVWKVFTRFVKLIHC